MLRNHFKWRKQYRVDTILSWYNPPEVAKYVSFSTIGFDKDGDLIVYIDFGNLDLRGLLKSVNMQDVVNYIIRHLEKDVKVLIEQSEKQGLKMKKWNYLLNFENFSLATGTHKPSLEAVGKMVSLYEANYPEMLKKAIVFNTSWYFQVAYAVIRPLITGQTQNKIGIYGKTGWQDELLTLIDADVLPAFLGGKRTDPNGDSMCRTIVRHGELVPKKYFSNKNKLNFISQAGVQKLTVNRLSKEEVELFVPRAGSSIEWEFMTKSNDISICLLHKDNCSSFPEEIIPLQRFDTSVSPESGHFKCEKPGFYYLQFDNSYSWIHQKEVYFKVKVLDC